MNVKEVHCEARQREGKSQRPHRSHSDVTWDNQAAQLDGMVE